MAATTSTAGSATAAGGTAGKTSSPGKQVSNYWMVTVNDKLDEFVTWYGGLLNNRENSPCTGLWGQEEKAPTTGHLHYQLLLRLASRMSYREAQKALGLEDRGNWTMVFTTPYRAFCYVTKHKSRLPNGMQFDVGVPPTEDEKPDISVHQQRKLNQADGNGGQGKRSDIREFQEYIRSAQPTWEELCEKFPGLVWSSPKAANQAYVRLTKPRKWATRCTFIFGAPGTGKSAAAAQLFPDAYWLTAGAPQWYDSYDKHETVVVDEFTPDVFVPTDFNRVVDRTPYQVPVKGGFTQFLAKRVIYISNYPLEEFKKKIRPGGWAALTRRVDNCLNFVMDDATKQVRIQHVPLPSEGRTPPANLGALGRWLGDIIAGKTMPIQEPVPASQPMDFDDTDSFRVTTPEPDEVLPPPTPRKRARVVEPYDSPLAPVLSGRG